MRILGVNGIWCFNNPVVPSIAKQMSSLAPIADIRVTEERAMWPIDIPRMMRYRESLIERYDDGLETIILGHSLGGVIACAVAKRFVRTPVVGIVTVNSPHAYIGYSKILGATGELPGPIVTFQGARDKLVRWGTKHRLSKRHTVFGFDHWRDIATDTSYAQCIARVACEAIFAK